MTPQQIDAMKLALEALEGFYEYGYDRQECFEHITAIKEALAEHAMSEVQRLGQEIEQELKIKTTDPFESSRVADYNRGWNDCLFASGVVKQTERHELQAKGEHPAPCARHCESNAFQIVIKNLKAQLAQPEQEPVAFYVYKPTLPRGHLGNVSDGDLPWVYDQDPSSGYSARMLVYTTPPQRKPLTEQEIGAILEDINAFGTRLYTFARAIEAAHGIKENT